MDLDDFRAVLDSAGVDVWTFIDTAIDVASLDYGNQLKHRRDGIVERLYALTSASPRCRNCEADCNPHARTNGNEIKAQAQAQAQAQLQKESSHEGKGGSPSSPQSFGGDDELDPYGGLFDDEQRRILEIKEQLELPDQPEDNLVELLQILADMDITFQALKETDIGRHVNLLRKHSSNDVRRLVKHLVRKWKDIVDEWVRVNQPGQQTTATLIAGGDSPLQKVHQNGHHQVPDFAYSPNPHNGSSGSDRNNSEPEPKPKATTRKEVPSKPAPSPPTSASVAQNRQKEQKESSFDSEKMASTRRRLQENYKEAENAKRQRTIQVMDIHELPKPKNRNGFFPKNKGHAGGSQGRHW